MSTTTITPAGGPPTGSQHAGRHRYRTGIALAVILLPLLVTVTGFLTDVASWTDKLGLWRTIALLAIEGLVSLAAGLLLIRPQFMPRPTRMRWIVAGACVALAVGAGVGFATTKSPSELRIEALQQQWDGKLAWDVPGCTNVDSAPVDALPREVIGPNGDIVGTLVLRTFSKRDCPPVIWARLLWGGTEQGRYRIPPGWTLHMVTHRNGKAVPPDEIEPSRDVAVRYALSDMLVTEPDCVNVEAFFTNDHGAPHTPSTVTTCETA